MQAEDDLRNADLSHYSLAAIEKLALLAMGDPDEARRVKMSVYRQRLLSA